MTNALQNRFQTALQARRDEMRQEIGGLRERLAFDPASDPMDQIRGIADRDLAGRHVDRLCGVLRRVEAALREIRDRTFGVCVQCGESIPAKRLEAAPWSPFCVSCQELAEQAERDTLLTEEAPYALAS